MFTPTFPSATLAGTTSAPSRNFDEPSRFLATMLLAAIVSALVVVADALIDSYADGHLLLAWSVLWAVGFAAMALFANTAQGGAKHLLSAAAQRRQRRARKAADHALMALAERDPRVMADLQAAIERACLARQEKQSSHGRAWLAHRPVGTLHAAYTGPRRVFRMSPLPGLPTHLQCLAR